MRLLKDKDKMFPKAIGQVEEGTVFEANQFDDARLFTFENVLNNLRKCI